MATGALNDDRVIVSDQADGNTLYNKGYFGKPISGGGLELELYEALHLQESNRLNIIDENRSALTRNEMMKKLVIQEPRMVVKYPVYSEMRSRGYILKDASKPADFRVFPRGGGPGKSPSQYWLVSKAETDKFSIEEFQAISHRINQIKKQLITGLLDEEGDVTYYDITTIDLKGTAKKFHLEQSIKGTVFGDKCYLDEDGIPLHEQGFFGHQYNGGLQLSLVETLFLIEEGALTVKNGKTAKTMEQDTLWKYADDIQKDFPLRYAIYKDLRNRKMIPKTGFKYGTAFRSYVGNPDEYHAEFMIQPVEPEFTCSWYDVSRAVRVAHTVRKTFVFARNTKNGPVYLRIKRKTP